MDEKRWRTTYDLLIRCDTLAWKGRRRILFSVLHQQRGAAGRSRFSTKWHVDDQESSYRSIVFFHSEPSLTDEMRLGHRLQVTNDDVFEKPGCCCPSSGIIVPYPKIIQWPQRSAHRPHQEKSVPKETIIPRNSHDERIDTTTLEDFSLRIAECSDACFVLVTSQNKMNLRGRPWMSSSGPFCTMTHF